MFNPIKYIKEKRENKKYKELLIVHSLNTILQIENIVTKINTYIDECNDTVMKFLTENKDGLDTIAKTLEQITKSPELTTEFYENIAKNAKEK